MLKHFLIATLVSATGTFASVAMANEMTMPGGTFAAAGSATGEVETAATAVRDGTASHGAMHETTSHTVDQTPPARVQPDSAVGTRTDSTHAAVGTDAAATTDGSSTAAAHRNRQRTHWQSLLPGVMK
jgi:hypothetical protein